MKFIPFLFTSLLPSASARYRPVPREDVQIPVPPISPLDTVHESLIESSIIPEVLDDFKPSYSIDIIYSSSHTAVQLGNDIPVPEVQDPPVFEIHGLDVPWKRQVDGGKEKEVTYTLILTDPDAKSRDNPKWSEMCHWIVTNLSISNTVDATSQLFYLPTALDPLTADELVSYLPPGPPPKTGKHRYVFVLLKGKEGDDLKQPDERKHWGYRKKRHGVRDWAEEMELEVVGANWFYAMNEKQ